MYPPPPHTHTHTRCNHLIYSYWFTWNITYLDKIRCYLTPVIHPTRFYLLYQIMVESYTDFPTDKLLRDVHEDTIKTGPVQTVKSRQNVKRVQAFISDKFLQYRFSSHTKLYITVFLKTTYLHTLQRVYVHDAPL